MTVGECIKDWLGLGATQSFTDWLNEEAQNESESENE